MDRAQDAAQALSKAANQTKATFVILALATGIGSAILTSAFWLWLAPTPTVVHQIDAQEVANLMIKAELTEPPAPSKGKPKR